MLDTEKKEPATSIKNIGSKIRRARRARRMKLKEVADLAGCSESMLSKIENNKATPSLVLLHKVVTVLGTNISYFFSDASDHQQVVQNLGERPVVEIKPASEGGISLELLIPEIDSELLQANIHIVPPGAGSEGAIEHDGEEVGYVLSGTLELIVGAQNFSLKTGDSFFFRSNLPHGYRNVGDVETRVIWVNSPSTF